jgi:hypothetical protein
VFAYRPPERVGGGEELASNKRKGKTMPKYRINYAIERWYSVEIEADNEEGALSKFNRNDHDQPQFTSNGDVIEDTIEIEEDDNE